MRRSEAATAGSNDRLEVWQTSRGPAVARAQDTGLEVPGRSWKVKGTQPPAETLSRAQRERGDKSPGTALLYPTCSQCHHMAEPTWKFAKVCDREQRKGASRRETSDPQETISERQKSQQACVGITDSPPEPCLSGRPLAPPGEKMRACRSGWRFLKWLSVRANCSS